jgi:oligopeptide transport system substrate-binding protein
MRSNKLFLLLGILTVLILLVTSCGTATSSTTTSTTTGTTTAAIPSTVFTTNLYGEPATIDPNKASWADQLTIIRQVYVGLLGFNQDLSVKAVGAKEIPSVANGGISSDGLTYTFHLRPDVTWSDGQKVVAKDYVYGIKRMLSPELASEYASFYYDIAGAEAYNSAADKDDTTKTKLRDAVDVKALDEATLQIKLAQQRPTFISIMALWCTDPAREDIITKYGDKWTEAGNYIGNGPFKLTEWVHQDHMTFTADPNYWGTKAKVGQIVIKMIEDQNAAYAAYKNNELDMVQPPAGTEKSIMADPVLSKEILRYSELTTFAFQFNVTKAPFDNVKVRQAFSSAVDRVAFINNVRGGVGQPAYSWIPPGMPGYNANTGKDYTFNVAKSKQLLADAGYADVSKLPPIKFSYNNSGLNPTIAQFLQGQMKDNLGINITLDPLESKALTGAVNSGNFQWAWFGWGADYPDPDDWLPSTFQTGAGNNHTQYSNKEFDALCDKANHELDNTKRLQEWDQAQTLLMQDAPIVTMFYRERFWLVKPYVKGMMATGMDGQIPGDFFYDRVSISK